MIFAARLKNTLKKMINNNISGLLQKLNINPNKISLYIEAMTHSSYANENGLNYNYERLEFLGDAIIGAVVSSHLYNSDKSLSSGEMTKKKILVIQSKTESKAAKALGLNDFLMLGNSFNKEINQSILEDSYESLIGAVFLDQGIKAAEKMVIETLCSLVDGNIDENIIDYKSKIQELTKQYSKKAITYKIANNQPNAYVVELWWNNIKYGQGVGKKIKEAEQNAAKEAYKKFTRGQE